MPDGRVVGQKIVSASFEEWIKHVFDHPRETDGWWWDEDAIDWAMPAEETAIFLRETFERAGTVLKPFNDGQVASGLRYISNPSCSDIPFVLKNDSVSLADRRSAMRSLQKLYSDCFARRCLPVLSHLNEGIDSPLNGVCYMWWDPFPFHGNDRNEGWQEIDAECLGVMEFALGLESDACRESALHGLGAWDENRDGIKHIIDRFLDLHSHARPELLDYARKAREAGVL
jgi:hypothetical protein